MTLYVTLPLFRPPSIAQLDAFHAKVSDVSDRFPTHEIIGLIVSHHIHLATLATRWLNAYNTVYYATYKVAKKSPPGSFHVPKVNETHPKYINTIREFMLRHAYSYRVKSHNGFAYNRVTRRRRTPRKVWEIKAKAPKSKSSLKAKEMES